MDLDAYGILLDIAFVHGEPSHGIAFNRMMSQNIEEKE